MLSLPLMKKSIKQNLSIWGIMTAILSLFLFAMVYAAGAAGGATGTGGGLLSQFFSLFSSILPLVYLGIAANRLLASKVDNGSLCVVMACPVKRQKVSGTQGVFLAGSLLAMYLVMMSVGLIAFAVFGEAMAVGTFLLMLLGSFLLNLAMSAIAYFATCFFNVSRFSIAVGMGVPFGFFLISMLSTFLKDFSWLKYFSLNTLFNSADIMSGSLNMIWQFLILFVIAAVGYVGGMVAFRKKDLPL